MKNIKYLILFAFVAMFASPIFGQSCYWVFLADKAGTTFDPYAYFDAKAIERYNQCGADLYDFSNYPLSENYVGQVNNLAAEEVGQSRWLNAMAVMATPAQIDAIAQLPCVREVVLIATDMQIAAAKQARQSQPLAQAMDTNGLTSQLIRMQGQLFVEKGYDGTGIRIAVLDGGFPRVNTHKAFAHLRDNHRILDTWNFPNKKADVYGWSSHGLSTLSCITGVVGKLQLGLATGSEFLLYRTEVDLEPFKEEVWWMMGMERADQHGANIISSSLGYGKERYYTKDMDGTSYVAKAGNLAAKKGILVCCSAGNEADVKEWKTIVTPSDADSVLCVGGIDWEQDTYRHISFSSYGPSADGRIKPNVAAFGHVFAAANKDDSKVDDVYGTSFSCPLTAGFAACAWQSMPGKTAMEMMREIERSADRYPYFDYALGYGVPQASYFTDKQPRHIEPTFVIRETKDYIEVHLLSSFKHYPVFYNKQRPDGTLEKFGSIECSYDTISDPYLRLSKASLDSCTLNVSYLGYTDHFKLSDTDRRRLVLMRAPFRMGFHSPGSHKTYHDYNMSPNDLKPSNWGNSAKWRKDIYFMYGDNFGATVTDVNLSPWSPSGHLGFRIMRAFGKPYSLGMGLEWNWSHYNYDESSANTADDQLGLANAAGITQKRLNMHQFDLELFQRVRFVPGGLTSRGWHWDLGIFVGWNCANRYRVEQDINNGVVFNQTTKYALDAPLSDYQFVFGAITRLSFDFFGIYLRYQSAMVHSKCGCTMPLPDLQAGIQLCF